MSNQKELLGKRIKELRKQKGYTQDYRQRKACSVDNARLLAGYGYMSLHPQM